MTAEASVKRLGQRNLDLISSSSSPVQTNNGLARRRRVAYQPRALTLSR